MTSSTYHISNAKIDRHGRAIATGEIQFPPDSRGYFQKPEQGDIAIAFMDGLDDQSLWIWPTNITKTKNGYLQKSKDTDLRIELPSSFTRILKNALGTRNPKLRHYEANDTSGSIKTNPALVKPRPELRVPCQHQQTLSNWGLKIDEDDGDIRIRLSASLGAGEEGSKVHDNYWPKPDNNIPKLEIEFVIDSLTRATKWGRPKVGTDWTTLEPASHRSCEKPYHIESGLFTGTDTLIAQSDGNQFGSLHVNPTLFSVFSIRHHSSLTKDENGFCHLSGYKYPTLEFRSVRFETFLKLLEQQTAAQLSLKGDNIGLAEDAPMTLSEYENGPARTERVVTEAQFNLNLAKNGLSFGYKAYVEEQQSGGPKYWMEGELLFSWPTIVIRIPQIAHHINKFDFEDEVPPSNHVHVPNLGD